MAATLASVAMRIIAGLLPWREGLVFAQAAQLLSFLPVFAIFARRLHDQGPGIKGANRDGPDPRENDPRMARPNPDIAA